MTDRWPPLRQSQPDRPQVDKHTLAAAESCSPRDGQCQYSIHVASENSSPRDGQCQYPCCGRELVTQRWPSPYLDAAENWSARDGQCRYLDAAESWSPRDEMHNADTLVTSRYLDAAESWSPGDGQCRYPCRCSKLVTQRSGQADTRAQNWSHADGPASIFAVVVVVVAAVQNRSVRDGQADTRAAAENWSPVDVADSTLYYCCSAAALLLLRTGHRQMDEPIPLLLLLCCC